MGSFRRRVEEVIDEELSQQGLRREGLDERVQEALRNIERRLADDITFAARLNSELS